MNCVLRKISIVLFILLGLLPAMLSLLFEWQQEVIRERMLVALQTHQLTTISLPRAELHWVNEHEVVIDDQLFDIATVKLENGVYTFTGLFDEDETRLLKENKTTENAGEDEISLLEQLPDWMQPPGNSRNSDMLQFTMLTIEFQHLPVSNITNLLRKVPTPPPQVLQTM